MRTLITGYAGFIGSNLFRMIMRSAKPDDHVFGLDCHTYAARPAWAWDGLNDMDTRFTELRVDLRDYPNLVAMLEDVRPDRVYHLAAESHVCRSIDGPRAFAETNFMGTFNLLEALRTTGFKGRVVHVSTDEVFGELALGDLKRFSETTLLEPNSPYAASKAASDMMVRAYAKTYNMDCIITRCTNNFGPNQHEEKLIPKSILSFLNGETMTIHGDGSHVRDWIHVSDHCRGLIAAMERGMTGEIYCLGSGFEYSVKDMVHYVQDSMRRVLKWQGEFKTCFTDDRPTDDVRYSVSSHKAYWSLGWKVDRSTPYIIPALDETVLWYAENMR